MTLSYPIAAVVGGDVWTTGQPSIALGSPESCTDSGDHTTYIASTHFAWDWTATLTVQCSPNGSSSWSTVVDYTFQWATGVIIFNTPRVPGTNAFVRISAGSYFTATQADATYNYTVSVECDMEDTTIFQSPGGWQTNTALIKHASGQISTYRNDDRFFQLLGKLTLLQLYIDKPNNIRWQFFALMAKTLMTTPVQKVETQAISFKSVRDVYFLTS